MNENCLLKRCGVRFFDRLVPMYIGDIHLLPIAFRDAEQNAIKEFLFSNSKEQNSNVRESERKSHGPRRIPDKEVRESNRKRDGPRRIPDKEVRESNRKSDGPRRIPDKEVRESNRKSDGPRRILDKDVRESNRKSDGSKPDRKKSVNRENQQFNGENDIRQSPGPRYGRDSSQNRSAIKRSETRQGSSLKKGFPQNVSANVIYEQLSESEEFDSWINRVDGIVLNSIQNVSKRSSTDGISDYDSTVESESDFGYKESI
ncbi:hypothetical protein ACOME3_000488 [Neoechinorhynchus agilis]